MSTFEQAALAHHGKLAQIDEIRSNQIEPALREFFRLKAILHKCAVDTKDVHLSEFLDTALKSLEAECGKMNDALKALEDAEMAIRPATLEEMEARLKHADELAELTTQRMKLHFEFIRGQAARLKAKLEELNASDADHD